MLAVGRDSLSSGDGKSRLSLVLRCYVGGMLRSSGCFHGMKRQLQVRLSKRVSIIFRADYGVGAVPYHVWMVVGCVHAARL